MELDSPNRPLKPPRGNKTGKEAGILMRVIKTLSVAASTDHRDREKTKLEKDFRKTDAQLDTLLSAHQPALTSVMNLFSHVCTEVTSSKEKIKSVKQNLIQCKMLLQCRREELQRLWLEGIEHKHALQIFDQIETLREGSDNFTKLLNRKQYMAAVEVLMGCLQSWNASLDQIEGLNDLHAELRLKKDKIYETLKEELYKEIYHNFNPVPFEKRQGSGANFNRGGSDRQSLGKMGQIKARKIFLDFGQNNGNFMKNTESLELDTFIITVVDCMIRMEEVTKFVKDTRHNLEAKLMEVVSAATQYINEFGDTAGISESERDKALFQQLIQLIFTQFRSIVRSHTVIIRHLEKNLDKRQTVKIHNEEYLWTKVQSVLQSTLKIYFGLSDSTSEHGATIGNSEFMDTTLSINSYFVKRRAQRTKRPLFKFKYSLHGLNIDDYVVQGNEMSRSAIDRRFVCKQSPRNIIIIYGVVQDLCTEIEQTMNGQKCELRKFMGNNVNKVFVQQIYKQISDSVELARKNADYWKECISLEESKSLKCPRQLLQSVVQIGRNVQEVTNLAKELPSYSDVLAKMLHSILSLYLEACQSAYQGIVQSGPEDKGVISANWVKDADIQRLLKSLPSWLKLLKAKEIKNNQSLDESPEDVRNQNLRESDLLMGLFYGKTVQRQEIITDTKQMNQLAHLQESLEWFSNTVSGVARNFERLSNMDSQLRENVDKIHEIVTAFSELADVCLLVLNFEVRVHCFHFLVPMTQNGDFAPGVDTQNADPEVIKLIRDLSHIYNILNTSLQHVKCKFVFEGLGQLISSILIGCAEHIQRLNDNGVKKMCRNIFAIQKTLSDITHQPEQAMDHARQFYELFTHSPEELVNGILEKGPQFKELEYMNALKLLFRSKPGQKMHSLDDHLNRLSNILGDVGVVV